ncbi:MAG: hypothetical protein LBP78_00650 [Acidaminococcales bacterium]|jgi:carbon starvation protein|nr:hypothetical protein [Acidaminococcales bacterium]
MNILTVVMGAAVFLAAAYAVYGRFLGERVFRLDESAATPAVAVNDGLDFVPAAKYALLGQHFSTITAAGPINGPILAAVLFGWAPALLWVLLGSVFIGGVQDMGSLIASVRYKAKSISEIVRVNVSQKAWLIFMIFIWITIVYLIVVFTDVTASSFVSNIVLGSGETVRGSHIASSSLMYLVFPAVIGLMTRYYRINAYIVNITILSLTVLCIWAGQVFPVVLPFPDIVLQQKVWGAVILLYCFAASMLPVWLLMQPRGVLGGYLLYLALFVSAVGVLFGDYSIEYPAFTTLGDSGFFDGGFLLPMFPLLFITVACGACSGFHSLVSSGTTSKQLEYETDARAVGYGGMLLEGMVAVISIACVMIMTQDSPVLNKAPNFVYATGIGNFMEFIGVPIVFGITFGLLAFTTFVYDTLDVCARLGRYVVEEITGWSGTRGSILSAGLTVCAPLFLIFQTIRDSSGQIVPIWRVFWNTFGASNQLLAALVLASVSFWLLKSRPQSKVWLASFIPSVIMLIMANWALFNAIYDGWVAGKGHSVIPVVSAVLMLLSFIVSGEIFRSMLRVTDNITKPRP